MSRPFARDRHTAFMQRGVYPVECGADDSPGATDDRQALCQWDLIPPGLRHCLTSVLTEERFSLCTISNALRLPMPSWTRPASSDADSTGDMAKA